MKYLAKLLSLSVLLVSMGAQAIIINYNVHDANNNSGNTTGHGLYTFGKDSTGSAKYSIQSGTVFSINTESETATLIGSAVNSQGLTAIINLNFSNLVETNAYKTESGASYNPAINDIANVLAGAGNGDIDFFQTISGVITINGFTSGDSSRQFAISTCTDCPNVNQQFGLQFGDGANAKNNSEFGGSAWVGVGDTPNKASHWDLNLRFTPGLSTSVAVTEPSIIALFTMALFGLIFNRRRIAVK